MKIEGPIGEVQRRMAQTKEGMSRRKATFEALDIRLGQRILDLGCGGGSLLRELALAVGPKGEAVGIDPSEDQINAAKALCEDLDNVTLVAGSATQTDFESKSFDSVASIQVLEYIADVESTLKEVRRVLKPGGRFATVSVLWDHWRFHGPEAALNNKLHEAFKAHCHHQNLPLALGGLLEEQGFIGIHSTPMGFLNTALHENAFAYFASEVITRFAKSQGISQNEIDEWRKQLTQSQKEGRFGFVSMPVLTTACVG
ncbi:MAG: methyltransferase domain-containing protein [Gammaproteobacteria bacterium]|jgi:arsenite methyltransferase